MPGSARLARLVLAGVGLTLLAGCDTLGMSFGPSTPAAPTGRAIDYASDNLSALVFALDVPTSLRPLAGGMVATLAASGPKGEKQVKATLVLADGEPVDGMLPPPASGRTYYLFAFAAKDKAAVAALQKWVKGLPAGAEPVTSLDVAPRLCATAPVDPVATTFSVVPALPGSTFVPLVNAAPVASLAAATAGQLPPCGKS
jgi:hypothetical protein